MTEGERSRAGALPKPPKRGPSWLVLGYGLFGALVLGGYLWAGVSGFAFDSEERSQIPASVRQSPGGYRGYHLWYAGYQGGK